MPNNITISSTQEYSNADNVSPQITDWSFSPQSPLEINHLAGAAVPDPVDINTQIKNYIALLGDQYDKYYVTANLFQGSDPICQLSGAIASAPSEGYLLTEQNLNVTTTLTFENFSIYNEESITNYIRFTVSGKNDDSPFFQIIEHVNFEVKVNFIGSVYVEPTAFNFSHILYDTLPDAQDLNVHSNGSFLIFVPETLELSGGNITGGTVLNGWREYIGTDSQVLSLSLSAAINDEPEGVYSAVLGISNNGITYMSADVAIFETAVNTVEPSGLEFTAIKSVSEAEPQNINISGPGALTYTSPSWLDLSLDTSVVGVDRVLIVDPVLSNNMSVGEYLGNIVITIGGVDYIVTVSYTVFGNTQIGASSEAINFTDDYATISRFYADQDYHLNLGLLTTYFNYGNTVANYNELRLKLGFFNNTTSYFIGKTIKRIMKELTTLQLINYVDLWDFSSPIQNHYNPAIITLVATFVHNQDEQLNNSATFENLKFLKGRKPKKTFPNSAILNFYGEPLRTTPNSVVLFNFYKEQPHTIRVFKNGVLDTSIPHSPVLNRVFSYKHSFENYNEGDVIEIRLHKNIDALPDEEWLNNEDNYISQKYLVFPKGKESYHIGWEDEYGVLDCLEFTGSIGFDLEIDSNTTLQYKDFLETLRKLNTSRTQELKCNTGFILKDNTKRVESLINSQRAWLFLKGNTTEIALIPKTKKLAGKDSDKALYAYELEFEINPNNDYESYT